MRLSAFASVFVLAALVRGAVAQVVAPPLTATVVNFDDMVASDTCMPNGPITTEYAGLGVIFSGFGKSGGGLINGNCNYGNNGVAVSPPNLMGFATIINYPNGGAEISPETLTFYPPITYLQLDTFTFSDICEGTNMFFANAFAEDGTPVGNTSFVNGDPRTVQFTFSPTPAQKVVITSNKTCGNSLFKGVETFTLDNIAWISVPSGASKCAQGEIDAAGKKAKAIASCYSKALQKGVEVDPNCIQKAVNTFNSGVAKSQDKGDCLVGGRHGDNQDVSQLEAAVDNLIASSIQMVTGGEPGPNICFGKKLASIGKKAQSMTKCWSKAAQAGTNADEACAQKAAGSFNGSLKICGTPTQLAPLESLIDAFGSALSRSVTVPTTTTTTTTTSTTTTTQPPPLGEHLSFTTTPGTANCTIAPTDDPMTSLPAPPFSGELDSDTAGTTKIADLGLGCLYIGGGIATVAPSQIPENATSIFNTTDGINLTASLGTSRADCTTGPQPTQHCVNNAAVECTSDADCANTPGGCAFDPTCFFGPPIPVNGFPPTCVINVFAADGSGTLDVPTGQSSVSINLGSRVYLAPLFSGMTCPSCISGFCDSGQNAGQPCSTANSANTSLECPPFDSQFISTLPVNLTPLSSGTATVTAADGIFCSGQVNAGAFGQATAQAITQVGLPSGDLSDGLPHAGVLVSDFCIPATGNVALDGIADLPGPGSLSLPGNAQFVSGP